MNKMNQRRWLSVNSKTWLKRHMSDPFVKQSIKDDLRSRSAYKLQEIQEKYHFINQSSIVLDLGAAPGGWSLVSSKYLNPSKGGKVISVDLLTMEDIPNNIFIQGDFTKANTQQLIESHLDDRGIQVILSDMLHNTTGQHETDHLRSMDLVYQVLNFCQDHLQIHGHIACKYLQGKEEKELLSYTKEMFQKVFVFKPKSSRSESREIYLIGQNKTIPPKKSTNKQSPVINKPV